MLRCVQRRPSDSACAFARCCVLPLPASATPPPPLPPQGGVAQRWSKRSVRAQLHRARTLESAYSRRILVSAAGGDDARLACVGRWPPSRSQAQDPILSVCATQAGLSAPRQPAPPAEAASGRHEHATLVSQAWRGAYLGSQRPASAATAPAAPAAAAGAAGRGVIAPAEAVPGPGQRREQHGHGRQHDGRGQRRRGA